MKRFLLGVALLLTSLTVFASTSTSVHWDRHKQTVVKAANKVGVSPKLATAVAGRESGGNAQAKNQFSSASGLMGITRPTARAMLRKYGAELGLPRNANIMNPKVNALLGTVYLREVRQEMNQRLHRPARDHEVYLAYHFSPAKAERIIKARPSKRMVDIYPAAARGNKPWYYHKGGKAKSASDVILMAQAKVGKQSKYGHEAVSIAKVQKAKATPKRIASMATTTPVCMTDLVAESSQPREHPLTVKGKSGTSVMSRCRDSVTPDLEFDTAMVQFSLKDQYLH
ncbi:putative endolysin [Erwinia phage vB_EamM_Phobos]|uniref:transglycosylase n=1 Tax=Erwinia phage vB_EamM_Phobos TaxID=1883377 RepID=UPI00081C85B2|nr:transglycosylase [Erwinia phage vB_EamM_Phobos]ANZ50382.1 putative endolysin [Erwinia phage vB_EamM_Phobos]